ncbi:saccharopine dehydrogenase-like oxidoreductase [Periplaneta americana]|uniref:saccharopine dehydrogenase-like oxidoreductase n=1 Tax=Periplaneta americana TaxID=6978 RepID=UPI0037E77A23
MPCFPKMHFKLPISCSVLRCNFYFKRKEIYTPFFLFPLKEERKCLWVKEMSRQNLTISKYSNVCKNHFQESDILREIWPTRVDELLAMASSSGEKLDAIIFGATGYTGKVAVYEIVKLAKEKNITWGIAGRSRNKLDAVLKEVEEKTGEDLSQIPVGVADINDPSSLQQMASQARVIVNCVGPYKLYGEAMVSACIASGAHHVDVSGEPEYMEKMQLEYHKAAEEKGVYIVSACGFDSIPADLGTLFMMEKFEGDLNSVETYLQSKAGPKGISSHYGSWESAIYGVGNSDILKSLRQKLFPVRLPIFTPKLKRRLPVHKRESIEGWCVPFPGADRSVIQRSQRHFYEHDKLRPVQVRAYLVMKSIFTVSAVTFVVAIFFILSKFKFGRNLLLKYPGFFSCGYVSHEGPSEEDRKKVYFSITLFGEGWKEKLAEPTDQHDLPPNKQMVVKVSGNDPGYGLTSRCLLLTAITILKESNKMPGRGGVLPPAAAFAKTSLLEELEKHGMKFEVVSATEK